MTSKKRIGIYGDSFASDTFPYQSRDYPNWIDILRDTSKYKIKNHADAGTNFHYSYRHFLENYQQFDKNIVFVTDWGRIMMKSLRDSQTHRYVCSNDYLTIKNKKIKDAVEQFYTYIFDDNFYYDIHYSMIDSIRYLDPNVILVPCFPNSILKDTKQYSLFDLSLEDFEHYGIKEERAFRILRREETKIINGRSRELKDARRCHLTVENNKMLANKILYMIENNETIFNLSATDYVKPKNSFDFYFDYRFNDSYMGKS
jgi:hypothetical protein